MPTLYWIPTGTGGRLATMARPSSDLSAELTALRALGLGTLVCLLPPAEAAELGLADEASVARQVGLEFQVLPIADFGVPELDAGTLALLQQLAATLLANRSVVIHCRMGIGRSSLVAASVLVVLGFTPAEAFARIAAARSCPVPETEAQRHWVERFAVVCRNPHAQPAT